MLTSPSFFCSYIIHCFHTLEVVCHTIRYKAVCALPGAAADYALIDGPHVPKQFTIQTKPMIKGLTVQALLENA